MPMRAVGEVNMRRYKEINYGLDIFVRGDGVEDAETSEGVFHTGTKAE